MTMQNENLAKLEALFQDVVLTEAERKTLLWLAGWEPETVNRICGMIEKLEKVKS